MNFRIIQLLLVIVVPFRPITKCEDGTAIVGVKTHDNFLTSIPNANQQLNKSMSLKRAAGHSQVKTRQSPLPRERPLRRLGAQGAPCGLGSALSHRFRRPRCQSMRLVLELGLHLELVVGMSSIW